ncbi:hypothetical protein [Herbiconiux sp. L3-i23]|uniref:hypothetical protein n=1 Tax=Herbiconiux sp. L3-i23 TaxID=2905871 RepID=UPI0020633B2F|nr:hypothetical protein [Herbiconiux sp. L3-i23]BDI23009.1 hypothetical protein L3i23_17850 [Herbiconiux sp. L3-i23]
MRLRSTAFIAVPLLTALAIAGCTATPQPAPTTAGPQRTTTPTPTVTATPTAAAQPTVDGLVVRPEVLEFRSSGSVVETFDYMTDPGQVVAALTALFGRPPVDEPIAGNSHFPPGVTHAWGNVLIEEGVRTDRWVDIPYTLANPRFRVRFIGPAEGSVWLSSVDGQQAGDSWQLISDDPDSAAFACQGSPVELSASSGMEGYGRTAVIARESDDWTTVLWIGAPDLETTGCA